jgi:hypothetical protein
VLKPSGCHLRPAGIVNTHKQNCWFHSDRGLAFWQCK